MGKSKLVAIRMDEDMIARLEQHADRMAELIPAQKFTRADAARALIEEGLRGAEKKRRR